MQRESDISLPCGQNIHYIISGNGPHIGLLMPGVLGTCRAFLEHQLSSQLLHKHLTLVIWDPPGCGESVPPERTFPVGYYRRDARLAAQFMASIGFQKFSLLGWCDGGVTAIHLAAMYPENVHKLILWGSKAFLNGQDVNRLVKSTNLREWPARVLEPLLEVYGSNKFQKLWSQMVNNRQQIYTNFDGDLCRGQLMLSKIKCDSLIIHGDCDDWTSLEHATFIHKNIEQSQLVIIEEGRHNIQLSRAKEFNAIVINFLCDQQKK